MTVATEMWYTGYNPYTLEPVFSAKTPREKQAQRQFFFWYKPEERQAIERELRRLGRTDLIAKLYDHAPQPSYRTNKSKGNSKDERGHGGPRAPQPHKKKYKKHY